MKICVIGTGYVGLVAGVCLAEIGHRVTCVDVDAAKVAALEAGEVPIHEPGLDALLHRNRACFRATTDLAAALAEAEVAYIAVGTPRGPDGAADLSAVFAVAEAIGRHAVGPGPLTVVTKSTVPVGTAARIADILRPRGPERFHVVSNPEFLREGRAVRDFLDPDRIVVGVDSPAAEAVMRRIYAPLLGHTRLLVMDPRSSELTKYAANAMLATRISFINEVAALCDAVGADVEAVRDGMGSDGRIGPAFLAAGCGYGGSCFPKDLRALGRTARDAGVRLGILDAVEEANRRAKQRFADAVLGALGDPKGKVAAVWGLAFKPDTDDMREAPSRAVVERLVQAGCAVRVFDPAAMGTGRAALAHLDGGVAWCGGPDDCAEGADVLVICTDWDDFRAPDFARLADRMRRPVIVDGRNLYPPAEVEAHGFAYHPVGRGRPVPRPTAPTERRPARRGEAERATVAA